MRLTNAQLLVALEENASSALEGNTWVQRLDSSEDLEERIEMLASSIASTIVKDIIIREVHNLLTTEEATGIREEVIVWTLDMVKATVMTQVDYFWSAQGIEGTPDSLKK